MNQWESIQHKIVSLETAETIVSSWKIDDKKVVFTNGCFDILHRGHVTYLAKAADNGNFLVVGLNSDASVKRQEKGANRPINDENSRAYVLAALSFVDLVVIFNEDTPIKVIETLLPNVLVKGADYDESITDQNNKKYIVGSKEVNVSGGKVKTVELEEGFSTTAIIEKITGK